MNNSAEITDQLDPDQVAPALVTVPPRDVLTVDGAGAAEDPLFAAAVRALFVVRAALGARDDVALEGSYAQDGDPLRFDLEAPAGWRWRLLLPAPPGSDTATVSAAAARFGAAVQLRHTRSLLVAQLVHRGRYVDEAPSIAALTAFVVEQGVVPVGPHTEVYLTDPSRTAPAQLRTLLRMPVR